jgi:hypothetical protein
MQVNASIIIRMIEALVASWLLNSARPPDAQIHTVAHTSRILTINPRAS